MTDYIERVGQLGAESQLAVMVLLNPDGTDIEFWRVKPQQPVDTLTGPVECTVRKLRPVGVVGLNGLKTRVAFKEPLDSRTVDAIAAAFIEYVRVLLGDSVTAQFSDLVSSGLDPEYDWNSGQYRLVPRVH